MRFHQFIKQNDTTSYDKYITELSSVCHKQNYKMSSIGQVNNQDLYSVIINPEGKNTIGFLGSIHGNEIAGAYSILEFINTVKTKPETTIFALPLINPHGFNRDIRTGFGKRDLNRQWSPDKQKKDESALVQKALLKANLKFVLSIHEDSGARGFYLYYWDKNIKHACESIMHLAEQHMPRDTRKEIYGDKAERGMILCDTTDLDSSAESCLETWLRKRGINNICTETPSKLPLNERIKCNIEVMKYIVDKFG